MMQDTLRYMTKLDRAINAQEELQRLSQFYKTANITPNDLFEVLKRVSDERKIFCYLHDYTVIIY